MVSTLVHSDNIIDAIKTFTPVEHRLEFVRKIFDAKWYNDSVSSSPTRTIAGLEAFSEEVVLICGGYDKNLDYSPIAKPILKNVKTLILIGQTADKIYEAVKKEAENTNNKINIYMAENLEETINLAKKYVKPRSSSIIFSC